jgi:hypothetical protein
MPEPELDDFTRDELRAMASVALKLAVDAPAEEHELMLRTIRFLEKLTLEETAVLFAICDALAAFTPDRRAVMLDRLISGEPLMKGAKPILRVVK